MPWLVLVESAKEQDYLLAKIHVNTVIITAKCLGCSGSLTISKMDIFCKYSQSPI